MTTTIPLSGSDIMLLQGVPFTNDYKHTRWFDNIDDQFNYFRFKPLVHRMEQANFIRTDDHGVVRVDMSIDELYGVNYMMFNNYKFSNKWFYAFVTELEFKNNHCTYVHFEIDTLQTWMFDMSFKPSFVVREHCALWNGDGTPVINTVDEGLNYGSEYDTLHVDNIRPYDDIFFLVMVAKSAMHDSNNIDPTLNGLPQPLSYYVHPFKLDGNLPNIMVGATGLNATGIIDVLKAMMTQTKSVDDVVSLYVTEYFGYNAPYDGSIITFDDNHFQAVTVGTVNTIYVKSIPQYTPMIKTLPNKYNGYNLSPESKLNMYPYTVLTLDDFKGNRVNLKNEYINSNDINITITGSLGTSNKVVYSVNDYLQDSASTYSGITGLEHSVINSNPNDIPVLNDMLAAFLQGHRNSIQNQKDSTVFNGITDILGNGIGAFASGMSGNGVGVAQDVNGIVKGTGNTILSIQGIEAKQKDIANIPPSLGKMGSNSNYDFGNFVYGLFVIKKQIKPEYIKKLNDFLNMFGYKKNEVKIPNFHTRNAFNYVQTKSCMISGNFNVDDVQELKNIFDSGITLWHTDDIGNYALDNSEI